MPTLQWRVCGTKHREMTWGRQDATHKRLNLMVARGVSLQEVFQYQKIKGQDTPADGLTKHVRCKLAQRYAQATHMDKVLTEPGQA